MRAFPSIVVLLILASCSIQAAENSPEGTTLNYRELQKNVVVIGALDKPLGDAAVMDGTIVAGASLNRLELEDRYLIEVKSVDGKPLQSSVVLPFKIPSFADVAIADDIFSLRRLRTGRNTGVLTSVEIKELEKGYVGTGVHLLVYEEGHFSGFPRHLPEDVAAWQGVGYGFSTCLVVLKAIPENEGRTKRFSQRRKVP
ncbi:MAG: hypothetical protein PHR35_07340 [Kiritimatiellae bacterium]|nr:hypothetical protein [Kiritimatiellia bacterium]